MKICSSIGIFCDCGSSFFWEFGPRFWTDFVDGYVIRWLLVFSFVKASKDRLTNSLF